MDTTTTTKTEQMTFSQALNILTSGQETKMRRKAWGRIYYCFIDNRFPDKFIIIYDKPFFTDEDLLASDWERYIKS